jgi:hypothetical protein
VFGPDLHEAWFGRSLEGQQAPVAVAAQTQHAPLRTQRALGRVVQRVVLQAAWPKQDRAGGDDRGAGLWQGLEGQLDLSLEQAATPS